MGGQVAVVLNWSRQDIEALAADAVVWSAALELAWSAQWVRVGRVDSLLWGEYRGSGRGLYRVLVEPASKPPQLTRLDCTCPSRKRPCKHALGLLLQAAAGLIESGDPGSDPVGWLREAAGSARRASVPRSGGRARSGGRVGSSRPADSRRGQREQRVRAGLEELDLWLTNLLEGGLAAATASLDDWERMARRLVDAQAPGLAARLRRAAALRGDGQPDRLLEELALLHLASTAFQRSAQLSDLEQADLRAFIGWSQRRELTLDSSPRTDHWLVLGGVAEAGPPVNSRRIWLEGQQSGALALLIDYADETVEDLRPGVTIPGGLRYFPSAWPLRAVLDRSGTAATGDREGAAQLRADRALEIEPALRLSAAALACNPWLELIPLRLAGIVPRQIGGAWFAVDRQGDGLPLATEGHFASTPWRMLALGGDAPLDLFGEWDGRLLRLLTAWVGQQAIDLVTGIGGE